jgi:hypothetical protein
MPFSGAVELGIAELEYDVAVDVRLNQPFVHTLMLPEYVVP